MKRSTGKQLMNLGLKLALMIKGKLITRIRQIWREMQFTEQEKKQLKYLLSRKGKRKREELWNEVKEKRTQKLGLTGANAKAYRNLEEGVIDLSFSKGTQPMAEEVPGKRAHI